MSKQFSQVLYPLIKKVLVEKLGFDLAEEPSRYYVFRHKDTDTLIVLPILPQQNLLALMNYRTIQSVLEKQGIMGQEEFQKLVTAELNQTLK
jgi:hypothetical protein